MQIVRCTPDDEQQIVAQIVALRGSERTLSLHHPLFVHEPGDTAFCVKDGQLVAAYLFGLIAQTGPTAYVHLVGMRATYRRCGLARQHDGHVVALPRGRGCTALQATTTPGNSASIAFHRAPGMEPQGLSDAEGMPVIRSYAGPGQDRVVLYRRIV